MVRTARWSLALGLAMAVGGCANFSAKITGSSRAGSEQLLMTGTWDRALACVDFRPLAGAAVFLDATAIEAPDAGWIRFSLKRAMARQGLRMVDDRKAAQVIVEAALGAYGTDEIDRRLSLPGAGNVSLGPLPVIPTGSSPQAISRTNWQDSVIKLALTAYDATTRQLVWESGTILGKQAFDRRYVGSNTIWKWTTLPELDDYPLRRR